jgi:bis(5'-nucleosyl)-tetraphosphatase (symmetrical)
MDTGCVWGGCLSALRLEEGSAANALQSSMQTTLPGSVRTELIQVTCEQAQVPG